MKSDPESQLKSAACKLSLWPSDMKNSLLDVGGKLNFTCEVSPANSPWRQGKCERRIGVSKRLIKIAVSDCKLSPLDLQTVLFEAANLCNERPIGINKYVQFDETYQVLTPNCLIIGQAENGPMRDKF